VTNRTGHAGQVQPSNELGTAALGSYAKWQVADARPPTLEQFLLPAKVAQGRSMLPPLRITAPCAATTIGLVAGCLSSWSLVPQLLKCWRDGLTEAVSKKMFATRALGLVLWVVYGFFAGSG